ncbi:hypothetical protein JI741_27365 [Chryseolinea sp. Jin1]|uniref:Lipoprotein n=1 Tax=Chryseolinea lacunae TaxID=2801331 RepID=A0ABS1L060_9BACT|nr:hypothetical protein [Chryseolinea lacunae]
MRKFGVIVFLTVLLLGCVKKSSTLKLIQQKGFIIVNNSDQWRFIPARSMNSGNCFGDLNTDNLSIGFSFSPSSCPNSSYVKRTFDTLTIENESMGFDPSLTITPVSIEYEMDEYPKINPKLRSNFRGRVAGKVLEYRYDIFPIRIIDVNPLFCLNKRPSDISECACTHRDDDPDDYLFKICEYTKMMDRYSDLPCRYEIRQISEDSINAQLAIKVELTCCYLGDIAFFDKQTNRLLKISYGPK